VPTLNELIAMAQGEFLARMDADDVALPDRFECQVAFLREHPDVGCVGGAILEIDEVGRELIMTPCPTDDASIQEKMLQGTCAIVHPTAMIRREAALAVGGYREEMLHLEDLDLWLRMGERYRLANLEQAVVRYRLHLNSKTHRKIEAQEYFTKLAADQACDRRGIPRRFESLPPHRMTKDRSSRHEYSVKYGWWGFMRGDRRTALHYALQAIWWMPLRRGGWHLLACSVLKPIRRGT
jgi:hypothetical protein